jgi:protein-tyrosine phosphatase
VLRVPITPWEIADLAYDWPSMHVGYLALLEHFRTQFADAVSALATADGPVVVHCQGGRDRTGLVVALVLHLVGVDVETIALDHARSDENWEPFLEAWFAEAPTAEELERRRRIARPAGRTMVDILEEVDSRYGGPRRYLLGSGASEQDIDSLVLTLSA